MTAAKIAISLPEGLVQHVRTEVRRGRAPSVSAYVMRAVEQQAANDDLASMLDEMLAATGGPMTSKERGWADRVLGAAKTKRKRR